MSITEAGIGTRFDETRMTSAGSMSPPASPCGLGGGIGAGDFCEVAGRPGWAMGPWAGFVFGLGSFSRPDCAATLADKSAVNVRASVMNTILMNDSACPRRKAGVTASPAMLLPDALFLEAKRSTLSGPIQPGIDGGHAFYESGVHLVHRAAAAGRK